VKSKVIILVIIGAAALLAFVLSVKKQETSLPRVLVEGMEAPALMLADPSGKSLGPSDPKGSVVFVNFWATWCPPCREELPSIQALYNRFKDRQGFRMATILYREDYEKAMAYLKENNFDFPVALDSNKETARSYGVTGVPETYIVDKKGTLRKKVIGPADWASPEAVSLISDLLSQ
jgi:DsbE subfamily thiol:disulfide oxidoreductase